MANTVQAKKRAKQSQKRALRNMSKRSSMRTAVKKTLKAVQSKNQETAKEIFHDTAILADRMAGKGIIHPNKAARIKSRLNKRLRAI